MLCWVDIATEVQEVFKYLRERKAEYLKDKPM